MTRFARFMTCALLCATVAACSDDDNGTNNGGDDDNTMSATIDGQAWTANLAVQGTYANGALVIGGTNTNQRGINIAIPNITQTGTYDAGPGFSAIVTYNIGITTYVTSNVGGTGTVTLTKLSATEAEGTFSVTTIGAGGTVGTKVITNGKFDVKF